MQSKYCDNQAGEVVAEKLRKIIEDHTFIIQNEKYHVTVSSGVADMKPATDSFNKNDLIDFADQAMFESKKKGRNKVTVYASKKKWFRKTRG